MPLTRLICHLLIAAALSTVSSVGAQQTGRIFRVGHLSGSFPGGSVGFPSVQLEHRALGYIEGRNIVFEFRYAENKPERYPALAEDLVRLKVDVIVAGGSGDTQAAKNATKTIPPNVLVRADRVIR